MTKENIELVERVIGAVAKMFKADQEGLSLETDLVKDLHAKSMNLLELQAVLESEFDIDLPIQEMMKTKTISDVFDLVAKSVNG